MKILLIMDPGIPVPPERYGGHERLVALFAEEYRRLGHEVQLLAGPGSVIGGTVHSFGKNDLQRSSSSRHLELLYAWGFLLANRRKFDLIHNFGRLAYLLPVLNSRAKKIMTYGRSVSQAGIRMVMRRPVNNLVFTACSNDCVQTGNVAGRWETVYNAIDFSRYDLRDTVPPDAPLMFLGRLDRVKGAHVAIEVAKRSGRQLVIGGNIPETADGRAYFKEFVEPHIDNETIRYLGPLNDEEKNYWLGQAAALLFPVDWSEPFGLVMIEAMACGTPVIAFRRGSVPEIVMDEVSGYIAAGLEDMVTAVSRIGEIDRKACRDYAAARFDVRVIARQYLSL